MSAGHCPYHFVTYDSLSKQSNSTPVSDWARVGGRWSWGSPHTSAPLRGPSPQSMALHRAVEVLLRWPRLLMHPDSQSPLTSLSLRPPPFPKGTGPHLVLAQGDAVFASPPRGHSKPNCTLARSDLKQTRKFTLERS